MLFGKIRDNSVKLGNDTINFRCLPENDGCIPLAVAIITNADGTYPMLSGRRPKCLI